MNKSKFEIGEKLWHISVEPFSFDSLVEKVNGKPYKVYDVRFIRGEWVYYCHWHIDQIAYEGDLFRDKDNALVECKRRNDEKGLVPFTKEEKWNTFNGYLIYPKQHLSVPCFLL